ncbi:expressed unknown protein [Seminavis robusta]|uniref:Uncharacterized protein n=1 Tax=Seminavis robusta TaxID=568900 RepID=A0A9N8EIA9_9STRA|nr:expressed unknown protein [Seminavis robusta]|eukprot:Sro1036_g234030.1 n/a (397) ;mRNA; f:11334-12524
MKLFIINNNKSKASTSLLFLVASAMMMIESSQAAPNCAHDCAEYPAGYTWCPTVWDCIDPKKEECPTTWGNTGDGCTDDAGYQAGFTWCQTTRHCIDPNEDETCPTTQGSGDDRECFDGTDGSSLGWEWCPALQICYQPDFYDVDCTCGSGSSVGNTALAAAASQTAAAAATPVLAKAAAQGNTGDGCTDDAGYQQGTTWCPALKECVLQGVDECPTTQGSGDERKCIGSDGKTDGWHWCPSWGVCVMWFCPKANGSAKSSTLAAASQSAAAATLSTAKAAMAGSDRDEHGCVGSAGYTWCPSLAQCIRSRETNCPVNGTKFEGPISIQCTNGACSVDKDCKISMGGSTVGGPYLNGLDANLYVPSGCTADCTGCQEKVDNGNGGRRRLRQGDNKN